MSIKSGFFNSVNNDRLYNADDMSQPYKRIISDGIFPGQSGSDVGGLKVIPTGLEDNSVYVSPGAGLLNSKWFEIGSNEKVTLTNPPTTYRIDSVYLVCDMTNRTIAAGSIAGTAKSTAASCTPPTLTNTDNYKYFRLANILRHADFTIEASSITDTRLTECGLITSLVTNPDVTSLFTNFQAQFNNWFQSVTSGTIPANTATKLATKRNIIGYDFDGSANLSILATSSTAADAQNKIAAKPEGFTGAVGSVIALQSTNGNTHANPTLTLTSASGDFGPYPIAVKNGLGTSEGLTPFSQWSGYGWILYLVYATSGGSGAWTVINYATPDFMQYTIGNDSANYRFQGYCNTSGTTAAKNVEFFPTGTTIEKLKGGKTFYPIFFRYGFQCDGTGTNVTITDGESTVTLRRFTGVSTSSSNVTLANMSLPAGVYWLNFNGAYAYIYTNETNTGLMYNNGSASQAIKYVGTGGVLSFAAGTSYRLYLNNSNTADTPQINVNGTTYPTYINGLISSATNKTIQGGWHDLYFDGTNIYIDNQSPLMLTISETRTAEQGTKSYNIAIPSAYNDKTIVIMGYGIKCQTGFSGGGNSRIRDVMLDSGINNGSNTVYYSVSSTASSYTYTYTVTFYYTVI